MARPQTMLDAVELATRAHEGQTDKAGRPYIEHPKAVAQIVADQGHPEPVIIAALLHDVVEDTPYTLDDLRRLGYAEEVVRAVDSVSRRDGETYMNMVRRAAADPIGRIVKKADNAHNSSEERLAHLDDDNAVFLRKRYAKARAVLEAAG